MKVALVGNQNSGKTTLFNLLTGMNSKIGNWPGVTIEKKEGIIKGTDYNIVDLPGIYSLSPYSNEEEVSRKFIFEESPDVIINIIDATCIERSLYLTTQLLELDCKVIIALNMIDILEKKGIEIEVEKIENIIGAKIIKISALKQIGIEELIKEIKNKKKTEAKKIYDSYLENTIRKIEYKLEKKEKKIEHKRFISVKLLEEDNRFKELENDDISKIVNEVKDIYEDSMEEVIATERYDFISNLKKNTVKHKKVSASITDKLDKIFLNKWISFPLFIIIMFLIYYLSVGVVGNYTIDLISSFIEIFKEFLTEMLIKLNIEIWIISLITDGIITGVGAVLNFIPQLIILFLCMSILETTGYMSRIALLLDKMFRKIGLSGKSLIPFIIGSGCSVPGIMGSRIIEDENERKMTIILTPFIPCSAKLPIISLFSGYFFKENSGIISTSLYFLSISIIILSAFIIKKFIFKSSGKTYISELPDYKLPNMKYVLTDVTEKVKEFIKRAGSVIFLCSIAVWFLLSFSLELKYGVNINESILATIGKKIAWIFYPMLGVNSWEAAVSSMQGLIAKEQVVSSMNVILELTGSSNTMFNQEATFGFFNQISAYAFMVFNLFSAPCLGAISAMKKELGSKRRTIKAVSFQIIVAWCLGTSIYQIGSNINSRFINLILLLIISSIIMIIIREMIYNVKYRKRECNKCPYCSSCIKG